MDGFIREVERITSLLDSASRVEQTIRGGPHGDYELYGNCLKNIAEAETYLRTDGASFKAAGTIVAHLERLKVIGQEKCDESLVNLLSKASTPVTPSQILSQVDTSVPLDELALPEARVPLSKDKLKEISVLSEALSSCPGVYQVRWIKEYLQRRSAFLVQSLQAYQVERAFQEFIDNRKAKGDRLQPFIELLLMFLPLVQGERLLAQKILLRDWKGGYAAVIEPAVDFVTESGETLLKLYAAVSIFLRFPLLNVLQFFSRIQAHLKALFNSPETSKYLIDLENLRGQVQGRMKVSLAQVSESIRSSHDPIRDSGTVDQLTSNVITFLVNIEHHQASVDQMLPAVEQRKGETGNSPFAVYLNTVLEDLLTAIVSKANAEKSVPLKSVYAMNNIKYMVLKLLKSSLSTIISAALLEKAEKQLLHFRGTYKASYVPHRLDLV